MALRHQLKLVLHSGWSLGLFDHDIDTFVFDNIVVNYLFKRIERLGEKMVLFFNRIILVFL